MAELRSKLFSSIHGDLLKPLGFRKLGRRSTKELQTGVSIQVVLESYPAAPGGPFRFSLDLIARWREPNQLPVTYWHSLPSYATGVQFWTFSDQPNFECVARQVRLEFQNMALPTIEKMASLHGLLELFEKIPPHVGLSWYYSSYLNLLKRLDRPRDQKELLQRVIDSVPRDDIVNHARQLMRQLETLTS